MRENINKFPIGSQWKTRAGHRAVVVDVDDGCPLVYHSTGDTDLFIHEDDGLLSGGHDYDLIEPWQEPRKGTFWVNVYEDNERLGGPYKTPEEANFMAAGDSGRIALVCVNWTENQGLEK